MTWDLSVRIYHWLQMVCIVVLIVSGNAGQMTVHLFAGLTLVALLLYRLLWAFVGPEPARISSFISRPTTALADLKQTLAKRHSDHDSHSPAGGYMVLAFWLVLTVQLLTGLVSSDDFLFIGPLAGYVPESVATEAVQLHHQLINVLIALMVLHVLAVFWVQHGAKQPLIQSMIHGRKPNRPDSLTINRVLQGLAMVIALATASLLYYLWQQNNFF
ncbi:cytochrome b/b6 domain-containing protein [Salinibius halmophilus]|uniref:cytochrome b/b6 domain-containing protein n=1 Tax=Salinibius halmophilus TaxID=1853216 RepID=UPI000E667449|nr:cytochrome b/b6 domain-containing protein [Salinibius halmophilus]